MVALLRILLIDADGVNPKQAASGSHGVENLPCILGNLEALTVNFECPGVSRITPHVGYGRKLWRVFVQYGAMEAALDNVRVLRVDSLYL